MAPGTTYKVAPTRFPEPMHDVLGRLKVSLHQNIYEADFEYGAQPMRWEQFVTGSASIQQMPQSGGVRMRITAASGDISIRQSRPYHRYQPGKSMFMATAINLGTAQANQRQRVGYFDDGNGIFFEQADPDTTNNNPLGMYAVYRSDISGTPTDIRIPLNKWNGDPDIISQIDWTRIQMLWLEYAWYGAGALRWGCYINGNPYILHQIGIGNLANQGTPWARTGNLPVRYEQRNIGAAVQNDMYHYGVSVLVEGRSDDQRGFTYSYGMARATPRRNVAASTTQYPVLSIRGRTMGTQEYTQANSAITAGTTGSATLTGTPLTANQFQGRYIYFLAAPLPSISSATVSGSVGTITYSANHNLQVGQLMTLQGFTPSGWNGTYATASVVSPTSITVNFASTPPTNSTVNGTGTAVMTGRITSNTTSVINFQDPTTGLAFPSAITAGQSYTIGLPNRGQLLPKRLMLSSDALCIVELISSTTASPIVLTGQSWTPLNTLGSNNSFAERDVSATAMTGGEVVFAFTAPAGGSGLQDIDLSALFALYNNIRGTQTDILTVAVSTQSGVAANVGAHLIGQEAMS